MHADDLTAKALLDALPRAVVVCDVAGRIVAWSAQAERLYGWREADVLGHHVLDVLVPDAVREQHDTDLMAALLAGVLESRGASAAVLPMDGFHFDDAILSERGLASRKGSPPTFDAAGLEVALRRVRDREPDVAVPVFDRSMELARAAARVITAETAVVIVEGNYLLLDEPPWRRLRDLFDLTVFLEESMGELERRLAARWAHHGREADAARQWIRTNDLPNARVVLERSGEPDIRVVGGRLAG